jgi:hypothetical protein
MCRYRIGDARKLVDNLSLFAFVLLQAIPALGLADEDTALNERKDVDLGSKRGPSEDVHFGGKQEASCFATQVIKREERCTSVIVNGLEDEFVKLIERHRLGRLTPGTRCDRGLNSASQATKTLANVVMCVPCCVIASRTLQTPAAAEDALSHIPVNQSSRIITGHARDSANVPESQVATLRPVEPDSWVFLTSGLFSVRLE